MKAVRIHAYGGAEALRFEDAPMPEIAEGDVLVRVVAASVNPVDWKIREGHLRQHIPYGFPLTLGWDVSGVVETVGEGVTRFHAGDAVYGRPDIKRNGTYAEYAAIRADELAFKPATVSHVEAASLPLAGITAWEALFTHGKTSAGKKVIIHAGAGGVGSLAIQMAKAHGAYVVATASGRNRALVESLGADRFVDYAKERLSDTVKDADIVIDTVGGEVQQASWRTLKPGGILVSTISQPSPEMAKEAGARGAYLFINPDASVLEKIAEMADSGLLRPVIGAEFALRDAAKAHALSESRHARGKIVLYAGQP